jgi:tetratricopeptide (TPR) repeat protein
MISLALIPRVAALAAVLAPTLASARTPSAPAAATPATASETAAPAPAAPELDGFEALLADEARDAMAAGDFVRAWHFYWRLLRLEPDDPKALRESGRAAHALGELAYAERALGRAAELAPGADPELHFIRAECLAALDRKAEAKTEYLLAERDIGQLPAGDRRGVIWLGRIYAVRHDLARARALYEKQLWADNQRDQHTEILMYLVEAHILADDWAGAEKILREYLSYWPDFQRAKEILAWVLEARGDIDQEIQVRRALLAMPEASKDQILSYARSLERAQDYGAALAHYREVKSLGLADVTADIDRMESRLAPEAVAVMSIRNDPSGSMLAGQVGGTMSFGARRRLAITGGHEVASPPDNLPLGTPAMDDVSISAVNVRAMYSRSTGAELTAGATGYNGSSEGFRVGGLAAMRARPFGKLQVHLSGELNQPWRESASTIREDGTVDAATAEVYATPLGDRLVFGVSGRYRRLGLKPILGISSHSTQWFGAAGLDYVIAMDPAVQARGEMFDHDLVWRTGLSPALVASFRHYELDSDDPFGTRLVLVEQSRLDEISGLARHVLGDGVFGAELRGGIGYDWLREVQLWRGGASLLVSVISRMRFSFDFDIANESGTGLSGRRYAGVMGLHVDL